MASVKISLVSVNGAPPAPAFALPVAANLSLASCPCTVAGPYVPPGGDVFTLSAYDGPNGTGNLISTASASLTIVAGSTNANAITLNGVPANLTIAPVNLTIGTPAVTPLAITVTDADGHTIMGAYANPIALSDGDASGATHLATSGTDNPAAGQLLSSSDVANLTYTGAALSSLPLGAAGTGLTPYAMTFYTHGTQTLAYTGTPQTFTVPPGATAVTIVAVGASGSGYAVGFGGSVTATVPATPGSPLTVLVGGMGGPAPIGSGGGPNAGGAGGYNGGGAGGSAAGYANPLAPGGGGGGATSILQGATKLVIAGGGGGGNQCGYSGSAGGAGGYPAGGLGTDGGCSGGAPGGTAGTQSVAGTGGAGAHGGQTGAAGSGSTGGAGGNSVPYGGSSYAGGGGGGGYFGGGGGGGGGNLGGGGGGGSSYYVAGATSVATASGVQYGNGTATISW